jgi:hypothetical protein
MPGSQHGPSIKKPKVYEALRRKGYSKKKAARISNSMRTKAKLKGRGRSKRRRR